MLKKVIRDLLSDDMILRIKAIRGVGKNREMLSKYEKTFSYDKEYYSFGINLIGDISAETGLGQSMRILAAILENGNIPFCVKQMDSHGNLEHNDNTWADRMKSMPFYGVNLINLIPETWAENYCAMDKEVLDYRYNIAYWPWELEVFPERWIPCIKTVDEIWTPSEFTSGSIRKRTEKPVVTLPHIIDMPDMLRKEYFGRDHFTLPDGKFLFLTMYDFISVSERKNPQAVIKAYMKAFSVEEDGVGLIIKVNHADDSKLMLLKEQLRDYKNIFFITENLTRNEVDSLMNAADVLVSLHRSEGFGLPVAEAMALGKPVISTNWSATTEFMDESCACPVNYKLITLEKSIGPYEKGNYWADADIDHAATYMKRLWKDREYRDNIGRNAREYLKEHLTYEYAANIVKDRLKEIYEKDCLC